MNLYVIDFQKFTIYILLFLLMVIYLFTLNKFLYVVASCKEVHLLAPFGIVAFFGRWLSGRWSNGLVAYRAGGFLGWWLCDLWPYEIGLLGGNQRSMYSM